MGQVIDELDAMGRAVNLLCAAKRQGRGGVIEAGTAGAAGREKHLQMRHLSDQILAGARAMGLLA